MKRKIFMLLAPFLLFILLLIPYSYFNRHFVLDWFGCGCPKVDELGNAIPNDFNANDFTRIFWSVIALCTVVISFFTSKGVLKTLWRIVYMIAVFVISLFVAAELCQMMMWK